MKLKRSTWSLASCVSYVFALLTLIGSTPTQAALSQWPSGVNICEGGWQYEQLKSCQQVGTIVDGVITSGTCLKPVETGKIFNACRPQVTDATLGCGPENYESCPSMSCPGSYPAGSLSKTAPGVCYKEPGAPVDSSLGCGQPGYRIVSCYKAAGDNVTINCARGTNIASCENSGCAVRTWKSCRYKDCGTERILYGCDEWSKAYADSCGPLTQNISGLKSAIPSDVAADGRRVKDFYGIGSACLTCDDIPVDTKDNIQKRFNCLADGYELANEGAAGYSFKTTKIILDQLQEMATSYSTSLTPAQLTRLDAILSD